jgi:hypothetical protein
MTVGQYSKIFFHSLIGIFTILFICKAKNNTIKFLQANTKSGLSPDNVSAINQNELGFMWIGENHNFCSIVYVRIIIKHYYFSLIRLVKGKTLNRKYLL